MTDSPTPDFGLIPQYMYSGGQVKYKSIFRFPLSSMGGAQNPKNPPTLEAYSTKTIARKKTRIGILTDNFKLYSMMMSDNIKATFKPLISGKFKNYQSLIAYFEVLPKEFTPNHF
jgi:hypothetical protein